MLGIRLVYNLLLLIVVAVVVAQAKSSEHRNLLKNSDNPQWEDLGWAWGKRSTVLLEPESPKVLFPRYVRSMNAVKKNPDWHDLGWAWGRK